MKPTSASKNRIASSSAFNGVMTVRRLSAQVGRRLAFAAGPVDGMVRITKPKEAVKKAAPVALPKPKISRMDGIILPALRVMALLVIVGAGTVVMPTLARTVSYFSDTEAAPSALSTRTLDLIATTTMPSDIPLSCGDYNQFEVSVFTAEGSSPANYSVVAEKVGGDDILCDHLLLTAWLEGEEVVHEEPLLGFFYDDVTAPSNWEFKVKLPLQALDEAIPEGATCAVDLVFNAYCPMTAPGGYTDEERIPIRITKVGECTGEEPCEPCTSGNCGGGDVTIIIDNDNTATVTNTASTSANTGGNSANGGNGGAGGSGGASGGNGGQGGTVTTGNATTSVSFTNVVNTNTTTVTTSCSGNCNTCTGNCGNTTNSSSSVGGTSTASTTQSLSQSIKDKLNEALKNAGLPGR